MRAQRKKPVVETKPKLPKAKAPPKNDPILNRIYVQHRDAHSILDRYAPLYTELKTIMTLSQRVHWLVIEMAKLKRGGKPLPLETPLEAKAPGLDLRQFASV